MNRDAIYDEFRKSSMYAGLLEYKQLTGDSRQLDALHDRYVELVEALSGVDTMPPAERTSLWPRAVGVLFEPVGQLDGHATAAVWKQVTELDEPSCRELIGAVQKHFARGVPLGPWSSIVFLVDDFEETLDQSVSTFLERADFHEQFTARARAMAEFVAFPWKPSETTRQCFEALVERGSVRDQVRRVVEYGVKHVGLNNPRVDAALVFVLAVSGQDTDAALLRDMWQVVQSRPREPKLSAERFEQLIATAGNLPTLSEEVLANLQEQYEALDSVKLLEELAGQSHSLEQLRDARFRLTVSSLRDAGGSGAMVPTYQMSLEIRPGNGELVARDRDADWLIRLHDVARGTIQTYTHRGLDARSSHDLGVELEVARPHDFPQALRDAARQLDVQWDTSYRGVAVGGIFNKGVEIMPDPVCKWLCA